MTIRKNIISAAALSEIFFAGPPGVALAGENKPQAIKPLQAFSFETGQKHGIGYFTSDASTCKLVVTLADAANHDDAQASQPPVMKLQFAPARIPATRAKKAKPSS